MYKGPYNTPMALASRPLMALFWAVFATQVALIAVVILLNVLFSGWASAQFQPGGDVSSQWLIYTLGNFAVLVAMTLWADRIGAGPFGGSIRSSSDWVAIGAVTGPIILTLTSALVGMLFSDGDPGWMYREDFDTRIVSGEAFGPLMICFAVLLAPVLEEIAFRGIGLGCLLARGWPPIASVVLTSAAFTGLHMNYVLPALIPIFIMGLYLGALRIISGSMAAPIAAHVSANGISMLVLALSLI
ncbi:MAG: type II CAAX endopeptidase family protein [Pseudomonadota bacterium]